MPRLIGVSTGSIDYLVSFIMLRLIYLIGIQTCEPRHDKTNKVTVRPAKTQISLGIRPVASVFAVHLMGS